MLRPLLALVLVAVSLAGCARSPASCTADPFVLREDFAGFGPPEWHSVRVLQVLHPDGRFIQVEAKSETQMASGPRILIGPGMWNTTTQEVESALRAHGVWNITTSWNQTIAFAAQVPQSEVDTLCAVISSEWSARDGGQGYACFDGGRHEYRFATSQGQLVRSAGCEGTYTEVMHLSNGRIDAVYDALVLTARHRAGIPDFCSSYALSPASDC